MNKTMVLVITILVLWVLFNGGFGLPMFKPNPRDPSGKGFQNQRGGGFTR